MFILTCVTYVTYVTCVICITNVTNVTCIICVTNVIYVICITCIIEESNIDSNNFGIDIPSVNLLCLWLLLVSQLLLDYGTVSPV